MPISEPQRNEIQECAESFVGAFVKCNCPKSRYTVSGTPCNSIDQAVTVAMKKIGCPQVTVQNAKEQDEALSDMLAEAIKNLNCE